MLLVLVHRVIVLIILDAKACLTVQALTDLSSSINEGRLTSRYQFSEWDACLTVQVLICVSTMMNEGCLTCRYQFSEWDASLNEITQGQRGRLPPSDARFRPDVRAIEDGRFTEVSALRMCIL